MQRGAWARRGHQIPSRPVQAAQLPEKGVIPRLEEHLKVEGLPVGQALDYPQRNLDFLHTEERPL